MRAIGVRLGRRLSFVVFVARLCRRRRPAATGSRRLQIVTSTGTHDFQVEIAKDDASRERGLMDRRFMPADRGMLFEFDRDAPVSFWMKNTYIPLDMIFISRAGVVTNIVANAEPLSERVIPSGASVRGGARTERRRGRLRSGSRSATRFAIRSSSRDSRVAAALHPPPGLLHSFDECAPRTKLRRRRGRGLV